MPAPVQSNKMSVVFTHTPMMFVSVNGTVTATKAHRGKHILCLFVVYLTVHRPIIVGSIDGQHNCDDAKLRVPLSDIVLESWGCATGSLHSLISTRERQRKDEEQVRRCKTACWSHRCAVSATEDRTRRGSSACNIWRVHSSWGSNSMSGTPVVSKTHTHAHEHATCPPL